MDEPWTQSSMQSADTGRGAGKTRQEEMDVEEKRNVNIIVHCYTIIHISRFFKAKKTGARPNMNLAQLLRDVLF